MRNKLTAEFINTFILVFAGSGAVMINDITGALGHTGVAMTFGFVIVALIYSFAHVSGAHFNPAVTIAFYSMGEFNRKRVLPYISAQILGAIAASITLFYLLQEDFNQLSEVSYLGATLPHGSVAQSFGFEFLLAFILMLNWAKPSTHFLVVLPLVAECIHMPRKHYKFTTYGVTNTTLKNWKHSLMFILIWW